MKFNTRLFTADSIDPSTGAVMPPVYQTSTFIQTSPGQPLNGLRVQ
jgi:cystathionine beta-lyase